jgi:hypothetical protein
MTERCPRQPKSDTSANVRRGRIRDFLAALATASAIASIYALLLAWSY